MASTNQTTNYGLPIYSQSDKASWVDTNEGFSALDTDLHTAKTTAESASSQATTNAEDITDLKGRMSSAEGSLTTITGTTIPAMQSEIDAAETAVGTSYNNSDSGLSSTTVQGAIDEVNTKTKHTLKGSVTADGTVTWAHLLHELKNELDDLTEIEREGCYIKIVNAANTETYLYKYVQRSGNSYRFTFNELLPVSAVGDPVRTQFSAGTIFIGDNDATSGFSQIILDLQTTTLTVLQNGIYSSTAVTSGMKLELYA